MSREQEREIDAPAGNLLTIRCETLGAGIVAFLEERSGKKLN